MDNPIVLYGSILVVAIIAVIVALSLVKKQQKGNTLLILGIPDAGKTSLFTLLRYGKLASTVTSMKENEGKVAIENKSFDLVDMPGHERVRYRYLDFLPVSYKIIFVLDSTTLHRQVRPVAEYLYHLLANPIVQQNKTPIFIACNKHDMFTALPISKIKPLLEAEINRLRATRTAAVEKQESDNMDDQEAYLGYEGEAFQFDHVDNEIEFEQCSILKNDIDKLTQWVIA
ncbi:signal recognition particle receptor beta subunit-domain-containing protein [Cunninghamella echinulata]|nr:signal recognition particle receptor beta subunit-domain-containing protein [Cunninghamella echinulata]